MSEELENENNPGTSEHHHQELGWWRTYIFSIDHKVIGIQYGVTSLTFLLLGLTFMMLMRWQLAFPGKPIPWEYFSIFFAAIGITVIFIGRRKHPFIALSGLLYIGIGALIWFFVTGQNRFPGDIMLPEFYNALGAMHGTFMIFLGIVPLGVGAFGNYLVPLQIGAPDMAFPKLNMASYWIYFLGGVILLSSFFFIGGAPQSGWTSYSPLAEINPGQTFWEVGMIFIITSNLLGSVNILTTIIQLRAKGLTWFRLPYFIWSQFVTSFLLLLAFPPLEIGAIFQLLDRVAGSSFFMPSGMVVAGNVLGISGNGNPILWQHLFWFLAHPEVYTLLLPAIGITTEIIANNTRKPLWGYKASIYSILFLGFMSFIVYAHHMFMTSMNASVTNFFQTTTVTISIPSIIILACLVFTMWGGSIRFNTPMHFALAFLVMFGIGGLTGIPLAMAPLDLPLHDTLYVIGHFHFIVAPGSLIALFGGVYYWFPKITGKKLNDTLGKIHFWGTLIGMIGVFTPMLIQGMAGVQRRLYDGGASYLHAQPVLFLNPFMSVAAWLIGLSQLFFIINFFMTLKSSKKLRENPWDATTLEWTAAPSPPIAEGNFTHLPTVYRGAYEYSVPFNGTIKDFIPQNQILEKES